MEIPEKVTDWVMVELRTTFDVPAVSSKSALFNKDGRIVADDGITKTIRLVTDPIPYHIVTKQRHNLPIMSNGPANLIKE